MPLADIADISISTTGGGLSLPGFGTPLILGGYSKTWPERVRTYATLTDLAVDFAAGTPEYAAAQRTFGQNPRPTQVKVGRGALPPTQRWAITPAAVNGAKYQLRVGAQTAEFTADSSATVAEITAGLTSAINGLTAPGVSAADMTTYVAVTAPAGGWQSLEVLDVNLLSLVQDHADPGVATDLAAIQLEDPDWYALVTCWNSKAVIEAAAAWVEANEKLYVVQTQDTPVIGTADSGTDDVAEALKASAYARTALQYDHSTAGFLDAALLGRCLPETPGSETWALKTLAGPQARAYTGTQLARLRAKRCGFYYTVAGRNLTQEGRVAANEWIDTIRGRDAMKVDMQGRVLLAIADAKKVAYTDAGATIIQGALQASLELFEKRGFIAEGSTSVTVPKVATQSPTDRGNRYFPGITFTGTLAGAIHKLAIAGTLSV